MEGMMGRSAADSDSAQQVRRGSMKLVVEWALCDGNGVCTFEAPELLELNEQDELVVKSDTFGPELETKVQAAVRVCPKQALRIQRDQ
jgi:ferredoxin